MHKAQQDFLTRTLEDKTRSNEIFEFIQDKLRASDIKGIACLAYYFAGYTAIAIPMRKVVFFITLVQYVELMSMHYQLNFFSCTGLS